MGHFQIGGLALRYLDSLTEQNAHGVRLYEIAALCEDEAERSGMKEAAAIFGGLAVDFQKINVMHEEAGSLSTDLYGTREYLRTRLRLNIEEFMGAEAVAVLNP